MVVKKENVKAEIIFNMKCEYNYQPLHESLFSKVIDFSLVKVCL